MNSRTSIILKIARVFYNAIFPLAFIAMLPDVLLRMFRRGNYRAGFWQRFGIYSLDVRSRLVASPRVWVQSISVGETVIAMKLIRQMRALDPALKFVVSVTTSTGFTLAKKSESDWLEVIYNPLDFFPIVRRALRATRPSQLVLIEGIWPELLCAAANRGLPVALVARLSPRSEARFQRLRWLAKPLFQRLSAVFVQEPEDVARWKKLGVNESRIVMTGNIKFDQESAEGSRAAEFAEILRKLVISDDALILLGGSTFAGEEAILAEVYCALKKEFPALFLILVPRHVERALEIMQDLKARGLHIALRSDVESKKSAELPPDCLLIDSTGELRDWYSVATLVFIGKSLTATGGQNPVEAVLAGMPVIFGPHMENFSAVVKRWLAVGAAVQVANGEVLQREVERLLRDAGARSRLVVRAMESIAHHQGATQRTAQFLQKMREI